MTSIQKRDRLDLKVGLRGNLYLYTQFIGIAFRSRMQYRSDFFVGIISVILNNFISLALIYVLVNKFHALAGWQFWEIVMLYATFLISHSVYAVFFWHLSRLEEDIIFGRFDQYLIRPCSPLIQFLGKEINYMGAGDIIFATAAFALAFSSLGLSWTGFHWGFFVLILFSGLIIETCVSWIMGTISFWTGRSRSLFHVYNNFQWLGQQYPLDVFGGWFRVFMTGFIPVVFMNYYPLTILLGKPNAVDIPWLGFLSPIVAAGLLLLGIWTWRRGLKGYTSSGS